MIACLRYAFLRSVSFTSVWTPSCGSPDKQRQRARKRKSMNGLPRRTHQVVVLGLDWRHGGRRAIVSENPKNRDRGVGGLAGVGKHALVQR